MASKNNEPGRAKGPRRTRNPQPHQDPYADDAKLADSLVCDDCNVVQHGGRWYWGAPPFGEARGGLCPACRRIRDRCPAGSIHLPVAMAVPREEVEHLIRSIEQAEKAEHPLERVIAIETRDGGLFVTTTGMHIARRITAQLERRFHSKPKIHYGEENDLRVEWNV